MIKIVSSLIKQSHIVFLTLLFFVIAGITSYWMIPKMENPDTNLPAATITTIYPGASSLEVEAEITKVIEQKIASMQQVDVITSYSYPSMSVVIVLFELGADSTKVLSKLQTLIDDVGNDLPDYAQVPLVKTDLTDVPAFIYAITSEIEDLESLNEKAELLANKLTAIDGVNRVEVLSALNKQVEIVLDLEKIAIYQLSLDQISQLILAQNIKLPVGFIDSTNTRFSVNLDTAITSIKQLEDLIVTVDESFKIVRLKDVATIEIVNNDQVAYYHQDKPAILLSGYMDTSKNWVHIGKDVSQQVDEFKATLNWRYKLETVVFAPNDIAKSVDGFIVNLFFSIGLIILVVMIGVKIQNALVVSLSLPLSILSTFIIMYLLKLEFHFISIAALIISLGILVDNGIVISEGIQANLNEEISKLDAILQAVKTNAKPVFTSTLTTMVTFGILFFIPGAIGKTVATIPFVVIVTLLASYLVAMFIIPVFAYHFLVKEKITRVKKYRKTKVKAAFLDLLELALSKPKRALFTAVLFLGLSLLLFADLGLSFFPNSNKPMIYINVVGENNQLSTTNEKVEDVLDILKQYPQVQSVSVAVGSGLPKFFITVPLVNPQPSIAQILVQLDPDHSSYESNEAFGLDLQRQLDKLLVGAKADVKYLEYSLPTQAKLVFNIKGDDLLELKATAKLLEDLLNQQPGAYHIKDTYLPNTLQVDINLNQAALDASGILKVEVAQQVSGALLGIPLAPIQLNDQKLDVLIKANITSVSDLQRLLIKGSQGSALLSQLATLDMIDTQPNIVRINQQRTITVLADVYPGYISAQIELDVMAAIKDQIDSDKVTISATGEFKNLMDLISNLGVLVLVALLLIYFILLLQFKTFKKPFIILLTIPLSLTGVFIGLYLLQVDVQAMALLGLVSLIGVVVNNGILLIDQIERKQLEYPLKEAIMESVSLRYRPIMLTTITTIIGLIPLILSNDPMTAPMALVLFLGLSSSTILTLVVVPVCALLWIDE